MSNALTAIQKMNEEYGTISGRRYGNGLLDPYRLDDAEIAIVCLGSTAGTVKTVVDELGDIGVKAGVLRIRTFRPLPTNGIVEALGKVKAIAVMDRSMSFGASGGPLFAEIRHTLYSLSKHPYIVNYIYGLGGRDTSPTQIQQIFEDLKKTVRTDNVDTPINYVGLRE
jgi:pyruvate ferredoxin oxidoreductase alpha subunit